MEYQQAEEARPYDHLPTLLIAGADGPLKALARAEAELSGYRIAGSIAFEEIDDWLSGHVLPHVVTLCLNESDMDRIASIRSLPTSLFVMFDAGLIDPVYAALSHVEATLLCNPEPGDFAAALSLRSPGGDVVFSDAKGEGESIRLRRLTEEVGRIARVLAQLSTARPASEISGLSDMVRGFHGEGPHLDFSGAPPAAADVRDVIRRRRLRDRYFGADLFADPAWDMLLDLYAARLEGVPVSVSSLCIAAVVPPTTALRWIGTLTSKGLFVRRADPADRRRIYIDLSDEASDAMAAWFGAADS